MVRFLSFSLPSSRHSVYSVYLCTWLSEDDNDTLSFAFLKSQACIRNIRCRTSRAYADVVSRRGTRVSLLFPLLSVLPPFNTQFARQKRARCDDNKPIYILSNYEGCIAKIRRATRALRWAVPLFCLHLLCLRRCYLHTPSFCRAAKPGARGSLNMSNVHFQIHLGVPRDAEDVAKRGRSAFRLRRPVIASPSADVTTWPLSFAHGCKRSAAASKILQIAFRPLE